MWIKAKDDGSWINLEHVAQLVFEDSLKGDDVQVNAVFVGKNSQIPLRVFPDRASAKAWMDGLLEGMKK